MLSGALAGARHATSAPVLNKTALVAGAAGKLGERTGTLASQSGHELLTT